MTSEKNQARVDTAAQPAVGRCASTTMRIDFRPVEPAGLDRKRNTDRARRQQDEFLMTEDGELTGNGETGRWQLRYCNRTYRCPHTARTETGDTPKIVRDWAFKIVAEESVSRELKKVLGGR